MLIAAMEAEFHMNGADPTRRSWLGQVVLPGFSRYLPKNGGFVNVGVGGKAYGMKAVVIISGATGRCWQEVTPSFWQRSPYTGWKLVAIG